MIYFKKSFYRDSDPILSGANRMFLYGEGTFTTFRSFQGNCPFLSDHVQRLEASLNFIYPECSSQVKKKLASFIQDIRFILKLHADIRLRINFFIDETTKELVHCIHFKDVMPAASFPHTQITRGPVPTEAFHYPAKPSFLKLPYYFPAIVHHKPKDFLDLNVMTICHNNLEAFSGHLGNLFIIADDQIMTPPLGPFVLDGIFRKNLIRFLEKSIYKVHIAPIPLSELYSAEEIFFTNSVHGIRSLAQLDDRPLPCIKTGTVIQYFNEKLKKAKKDLIV